MFTRTHPPLPVIGLLFLLSTALGVKAQILTTPETATHSGLGGSNVIVGTVFAPNGLPLRTRVRVRLSAMRGSDRITVTDESGNYAFRGLPNGNYSVSIDREPEYAAATHNVDVIQFRGAPPNTYTINFQLEFISDKHGAKASVVDAMFAGVPPKAIEYYKLALDHSKVGQHEAAIGYLELALKEHSEFMLAHNEVGVQFLKLKKHKEAETAFRRALELDGIAFAPNMNIGILLYQTASFAEAETHLRKAIEAKPDNLPCHYMLGRTLADQGRFEEAERFLVKALTSKNPQMAPAHRVLGDMYFRRGQKKQARSHFEAYLKAMPDATDADEIRRTLGQLD